jgi:hypothetical protein
VAARPSMSSASGRARPPSIVSSYQASRYHACGLRANGILSIEVTHSERSRFRHRVIPHNAVGFCMQPSKRTGCRSGMQRRQVATHGKCTPTAPRGAVLVFARGRCHTPCSIAASGPAFRRLLHRACRLRSVYCPRCVSTSTNSPLRFGCSCNFVAGGVIQSLA